MTATLMTATLWWLAENCLVVAALVVVVCVACRFLRNRPAVQHALWLLVLVKFVTPPIVTWPWSAGDVRDRVAQLVAPLTNETQPASAPATMPSEALSAADTEPLDRAGPSDDASLEFAPIVPDDHEPADMAIVSDWPNDTDALPGDELPSLKSDAVEVTGDEPLPSEIVAVDEPISPAVAEPGEAIHAESIAIATPKVEPADEQTSSPVSPFLNDALRLAPPMFFFLWLAGCVLFAAIQLRRIARHGRVVNRARPAPSALVEEITGVARNLNMRPLPAVVAREIAAPFVWCLGWLRMIWPESLTGGETLARSRGIIAHELAHVRRRDHWVAWLELAVGVVWWWNPLFWFVRRRLRESAEMACDAIALELYDDRRTYAEMFLELSLQGKTGAPAPMLGVGSGTPSRFERRLSMILSDRVTGKASLGGLLLVGVLAAVALPGWSLAQLASENRVETEQSGSVEQPVATEVPSGSDDSVATSQQPGTAAEEKSRNSTVPSVVNPLAIGEDGAVVGQPAQPGSASSDSVRSAAADPAVRNSGMPDFVRERLDEVAQSIREAQSELNVEAKKMVDLKRAAAELTTDVSETRLLAQELNVLRSQLKVERLINEHYRLRTMYAESVSGKAPSPEDFIRSLRGARGGDAPAEATEPAATAAEPEPYIWQVFGFIGTAERQADLITKLRIWAAENQEATASEIIEKAENLGMRLRSVKTVKERDDLPHNEVFDASADLLEGGITRAVQTSDGFFLVRWARRGTNQPAWSPSGGYASPSGGYARWSGTSSYVPSSRRRLTPEERIRLGDPPSQYLDSASFDPSTGATAGPSSGQSFARPTGPKITKGEYDAQVRLLQLDISGAQVKQAAAEEKLSLVKAEIEAWNDRGEKPRASKQSELKQQQLALDLARIEVERARAAFELFVAQNPEHGGKSDVGQPENKVQR